MVIFEVSDMGKRERRTRLRQSRVLLEGGENKTGELLANVANTWQLENDSWDMTGKF